MGYPIPRFFIMACIDNIVSIGLCDDEVSTSGYTLMSAAGMSPLNSEKVATEQYGKGMTLLQVKKTLAIRTVRNDFIGVLQANNIASTIVDRVYDSSVFNINVDMGTYAGYRGVKIHGVNSGRRGGLRKLIIRTIQCYPLSSGAGELTILDYESGVPVTTSIAVTFVADRINTFTLPTPYVALSKDIAVVIDNSEINFASARISCKRGCNGVNNPCAWADGFNGVNDVRDEGYGINVQFECSCDYESLMCDFSKAFIGELIWLKWQEYFFEEQYKTNRFNGWTTYNRDNIWDDVIPDLRNRYAQKYNAMVSGGLFEMLKAYGDECLNCRGVRVVTNV